MPDTTVSILQECAYSQKTLRDGIVGWMVPPHKYMWMVPPPKIYLKTVNVTLFGKRIFTDIIKWRIARWDFILDYLGGPFIQWTDRRKDRSKEKVMGRPKQRGWNVQSQVKECYRPPDAVSKCGISSRASGESIALLTPWFQTSDLHNCERTLFCCFKPRLW